MRLNAIGEARQTPQTADEDESHDEEEDHDSNLDPSEREKGETAQDQAEATSEPPEDLAEDNRSDDEEDSSAAADNAPAQAKPYRTRLVAHTRAELMQAILARSPLDIHRDVAHSDSHQETAQMDREGEWD